MVNGMKIFEIFKRITNKLSRTNLKYYPLVTPIYKLIYKLVKPKGNSMIVIDGIKMYVGNDYNISRSLLVKGTYEPEETKIFKENIEEGMIVIDIGANIGYYTLIASKLVGDKGKVYAFEPDIRSYNLLVKNIKINKCNNVIPILKAVSNKSGNSTLFINNLEATSSSLSKENCRNRTNSIKVKTVTLDESFGKIDIIKMDVEGAERIIIEGGKRVLKNNNLKILMEFNIKMLKSLGTDKSILLNQLKLLGYKTKHRIMRYGFTTLFLEK